MKLALLITFVAAVSMFSGAPPFLFKTTTPHFLRSGAVGGFDGLQPEELVDPFAPNSAYAKFQGKPFAEAKAELQTMHPGNCLIDKRDIRPAFFRAHCILTGFSIETIPEGSMVTMDYRMDRIRIFFNEGDIAHPSIFAPFCLPSRVPLLCIPRQLPCSSAAGNVVGIPHVG
jgi:hypothetical protein